MNYVEQIFERCNIESLCEFLLHGTELTERNHDEYYERARKAEKSLSDWICDQFGDSVEADEHLNFIHSVLEEIQNIYMQIGLQAGMMLASELYYKKNKTQ